MSERWPRSYRFATPAQWRRCLLHRFVVSEDGVTAAERLGPHAEPISSEGPVTAVAADPYGALLWRVQSDPAGAGAAYLRRCNELGTIAGPFELDGVLARSPRWIADRDWLWGFVHEGSIVRRYDRETLDPDVTVDLHDSCDMTSDGEGMEDLVILDISPDGRGGIWLLIRSEDGEHWLQHLDCEGRTRERHPAPGEACEPTQLGSINGGRQLAILAAGGRRLAIVDAPQGSVRRVLGLDEIAAGWRATRLSTDARTRIALWGDAESVGGASALVVLDASGDTVDGPLVGLFGADPGAARGGAAERLRVLDIAASARAVWLATSRGVWRLDSGTASGGGGARASESTLLTPTLVSPESAAQRGWLRAEVIADLPRGAVIEAQFGSTNDRRVADRLTEVAKEQAATAEHRLQRIWNALEHRPVRPFTVAGPSTTGVPIAIPLFESQDQWLWLRLHVVTPPGTDPAAIRELRVLYPDVSINRDLPAAFKGEKSDPDGFLRRLVGVLEATTQGVEARIRSIGSHIDPETTPAADWLDYLGRWLDVPWDEGLPAAAKRALLKRAGELLERRGTRQGLESLLEVLLGSRGTANVVDVTVDHPPLRIGGGDRPGVPLPMVLAGASPRAATLGAKAVLGRARLACDPSEGDPLQDIVPTLRVVITADRKTHQELQAVLEHVLRQYIPAGVMLVIRWRVVSAFTARARTADGMTLDADGPGVLGHDSHIGRTVIAGRSAGRIDESGLETGLRLT